MANNSVIDGLLTYNGNRAYANCSFPDGSWRDQEAFVDYFKMKILQSEKIIQKADEWQQQVNIVSYFNPFIIIAVGRVFVIPWFPDFPKEH